MKQMKILFSDNTLWGLLNFRSNIISHFRSKGYQVVLVAPNDVNSQAFDIPYGTRYISVEMNRTGMNPISDYKYYRQLKDIYKKEHPNYVFHYTIKPNIYGSIACKTLDIPSSCMIAGLGHIFTSESMKMRLIQRFYKFALRYPQKVLTLNKYNHDLLIARHIVTSEKLILLPGGEGVDLNKYSVLPMPNNTQPIFLMIGRVLYEKGYSEYIKAAMVLHGRAQFVLMGPIDEHPMAVPRQVINEDVRRGYIQYIPFSPDVTSQIAQADCIVLPSYGEGLSRVLMEACALGRPIICSDIAGCRETVDEGVNGYLCKPADEQSLIAACCKFIECTFEDRKAMSKASRKKAELVFDDRLVCNYYDRILSMNL